MLAIILNVVVAVAIAMAIKGSYFWLLCSSIQPFSRPARARPSPHQRRISGNCSPLVRVDCLLKSIGRWPLSGLQGQGAEAASHFVWQPAAWDPFLPPLSVAEQDWMEEVHGGNDIQGGRGDPASALQSVLGQGGLGAVGSQGLATKLMETTHGQWMYRNVQVHGAT